MSSTSLLLIFSRLYVWGWEVHFCRCIFFFSTLHTFFFRWFFFSGCIDHWTGRRERWIDLHNILSSLSSRWLWLKWKLSRLRYEKNNYKNIFKWFFKVNCIFSSSSTMLIWELRFCNQRFCCQRPTTTGEFTQFFFPHTHKQYQFRNCMSWLIIYILV